MSADVIRTDQVTTGLPTSCPDWCASQHAQALEEGCTVEEANVHLSVDQCGTTRTIRNPMTDAVERHQPGGWGAVLLSDHHSPNGHWGAPRVEVRLHRWVGEGGKRLDQLALDLTTGEARVLARQLLHLADQADLHS